MRLELEASNPDLRAMIEVARSVSLEEFDEFREALWKMTAAMREHIVTVQEKVAAAKAAAKNQVRENL